MSELDYSTIFQIFQDNDYKRVKSLLKENYCAVLVDAAAVYSTSQRKVSPQISRYLLQDLIDDCSLVDVISMANDLFNQGKTPVYLDDPFFLQLAKSCRVAILRLQRGEDPVDVANTAISPETLEQIATGPTPLFNHLLWFLNVSDFAWLVFGDKFRLTVIERIQRELHDDRAFWLLIRGAAATEAFASVTSQLDDYQHAHDFVRKQVDEQLEEWKQSGYQVEEITPGIISVMAPRSEQVAQPSTQSPTDEWLRSSSVSTWRRSHRGR